MGAADRSYGVSFANRVVRFIGVSFVFHLVLAPVDFLLLRTVLDVGTAPGRSEVLTGWSYLLALFIVAYGLGTVLGGLDL